MSTSKRGLLLLFFSICILCLSVNAQKKQIKAFKAELERQTKLAEAGDCDGILETAKMLRNTTYSSAYSDGPIGMKWLEKGSQLNCPKVMVAYGVALMTESEGKEFDSAVQVVARASALGYPEADLQLGKFYLLGFAGYDFFGGNDIEWNTKPHYNLALAIKCLQRAVDKGNTEAVRFLAIAQEVANEPMKKALNAYNAKDYTTAMKYFHYAAIDKDPVAMLYLGHMYLYGEGVKQNNFNPTGSFYRQAGYNGDLRGFYIAGMLQEQYGTNLSWAKDEYARGAERGSQECKDAIKRIDAKMNANYESWRIALHERVTGEANSLAAQNAQPHTCRMCHGSGKIESPVQDNLYQDKNGRWYKKLGTQYETCWNCKGKGTQ